MQRAEGKGQKAKGRPPPPPVPPPSRDERCEATSTPTFTRVKIVLYGVSRKRLSILQCISKNSWNHLSILQCASKNSCTLWLCISLQSTRPPRDLQKFHALNVRERTTANPCRRDKANSSRARSGRRTTPSEPSTATVSLSEH